jgi:hypothetical protein
MGVFAGPDYSIDYGYEEWVAWDRENRVAFVLGFGAGSFSSFQVVLRYYPSTEDVVIPAYDRIAEVPAGEAVDIIDALYMDEYYRDFPIVYLLTNIKEFVRGYKNDYKENDDHTEETFVDQVLFR